MEPLQDFGWFSIVAPNDNKNVKILAEIILPNHYEWRKICRQARIPTVFPLITELQVGSSKRIYISGNLANMDDAPGMHTLAGSSIAAVRCKPQARFRQRETRLLAGLRSHDGRNTEGRFDPALGMEGC